MINKCTCNSSGESKVTINSILRYDPTHTTGTRKRFLREVKRRFSKVKSHIREAVIKDDILQIKAPTHSLKTLAHEDFELPTRPYQFTRTADKIEYFMEWLENEMQRELLGTRGESFRRRGTRPLGTQSAWSDKYVRSGYQKGIADGRARLRAVGFHAPTFEHIPGGLSGVFNQPFHADRVGLIYTRTFEELKTVTEAVKGDLRRQLMATQISEVLAGGVVQGISPREIANRLTERVDKIGVVRASTIARTEVIAAHHAANIQEFKQAGIEGVEIVAEWATAGFNVCPLCEPLEGRIFKIEDIEHLIPRHPNCRCTAIPVLKEDVKKEKIKPQKKITGEKS